MGSLVESDVECCNGSSSCKQEDIIIPANGGTYLKAPFDVEEWREHAHKMVDFIADRYYHKIETFPVLSQVQPGYLRTLLPDSAPENPETVEAVLADVEEKIMPGLTHWQSPSFFGLMPASGSTASYLGEMLCTAFNIVGFSWITSPAFVELETIVLDWLGKALNLPHAFHSSSGKGGGVIQGTASEAVVVSLVAARENALKKLGANALEKLVVYASDQTHFSIEKACKIAGIHKKNFRALPTDSSTNYALSPDVVEKAISKDICSGLHPLFLCATIGTTSSAAVDPLSSLGKITQDHGMWFHIDAAYGGSSCICPEYQHYLNGVEYVDSFNMNLHKGLLTNFDFSPLWVKDSNALVGALSMNPEYLTNKPFESKKVIDYKDWQIPLGSRFRSLKLWMVLRLYGISNLQDHVRNNINNAKHFEELVRQDSRFEVMAPRTFGLVCFRLIPPPTDLDNGHTLNSHLLDDINDTGLTYLSHTVLSGKYTLRFVAGAILTETRHVDAAWNLIQVKATILLLE